MSDHVIVAEEELADGERVVVQIEGREICVFNIDDEFFAYANWCAHQAGPACEGNITGTTTACFDEESLEVELAYEKDDQILNCPWHGWEYDVTTGECLSRQKVQLPQYPVKVEDGNVVVSL
ncbi:Rieske (2Fe-2S) protein [Halorussus salinisoli]|uniref:Rieske (2Fe-2S) protein n=1 Tax=Halorussus salinisoli TaxID=2558242 RepID=UPI0010C1C41F|nr:Rieske (2Fe-2S) protein [Halorussus salinisoli]